MESSESERNEGKYVIEVLSNILNRLVDASRNNPVNVPVTRFQALKPPSITLLNYLERIHKYASCSTECFILALIYIDRLIQENGFTLTPLNVHRVVITR